MSDDTTNLGWPDPTEPGVPNEALHDGLHWLSEQDGGAPWVALWAPDSWAWIVASAPDRLRPEEMDHLHYLGQHGRRRIRAG
jgi:hypothetical protein